MLHTLLHVCRCGSDERKTHVQEGKGDRIRLDAQSLVPGRPARLQHVRREPTRGRQLNVLRTRRMVLNVRSRSGRGGRGRCGVRREVRRSGQGNTCARVDCLLHKYRSTRILKSCHSSEMVVDADIRGRWTSSFMLAGGLGAARTVCIKDNAQQTKPLASWPRSWPAEMPHGRADVALRGH